jgi:hypothetical protein
MSSFVGWVETTLGFVGFRCTQPNLHFDIAFAKCETQQWQISEQSLKNFFFDQTGRFFWPAAPAYMKLHLNISQSSLSTQSFFDCSPSTQWTLSEIN